MTIFKCISVIITLLQYNIALNGKLRYILIRQMRIGIFGVLPTIICIFNLTLNSIQYKEYFNE